MVVKLWKLTKVTFNMFESRVILDGSQTRWISALGSWEFESRVILDGSQTHPCF